MLSGTAGEGPLPSRPKVVVRRLWEVAAAVLLFLTVAGSATGYLLWRARQERATLELQAYLDEGLTLPPDTGRLRRLLEAGAPLNLQNGDGMTPMMFAVIARDAALVRDLSARGANVNAADNKGWSPLLYASVWNREEQVIPTLLAAGAAVDSRENTGRTPLFNAVELRHTGAVRLLTEAKADPNVTLGKAEGGQSVLTAAAEQGDTEIIRLLLEHGADVNRPDARGMTPLQWALRNQHPQAVHLLRAHGARH